jgi:hypothetical protein
MFSSPAEGNRETPAIQHFPGNQIITCNEIISCRQIPRFGSLVDRGLALFALHSVTSAAASGGAHSFAEKSM